MAGPNYYCLLLDCILDPTSLGDIFQTTSDPRATLQKPPRWVKKGDPTFVSPSPNTAAIELFNGDCVTFAVRLSTADYNIMPPSKPPADLKVWLTATISGEPLVAGDRSTTNSKNNSPFRLANADGSVMVQTIKIGALDGLGEIENLVVTDLSGNQGQGGDYYGFDYTTSQIYKDRAEDSHFEVVVAVWIRSGGRHYQFTYDPEMDTKKGG